MANEIARSGVEPVLPIPAVYLLHEKGGSPDGTVKTLQSVLELHWPGLEFIRPALPHHDPALPAEASVENMLRMPIPLNALLVGISLGGLVAAKLQEVGREDLQVIAISSPTWADGVALERVASNRLAFYSSKDAIVETRVAQWPELASFARDLEWLNHDTDQHLKYIARLFDWYIGGMLADWIDNIRGKSLTKQERDEIVWRSMASLAPTTQPWDKGEWNGGRPQTFVEIGKAMESGRDWDLAFGDWHHEFIFRKDSRCLAEEPPHWFNTERRAMLAGTAEFFARLYRLPKPAWVDKPEYFLPELEYMAYLVSESEGEEPMIWFPETDADLYRMMARSPKEMLRRNVVFEARNLTVL